MRRLALTPGDPNGIGPEIVVKSLAELQHDDTLSLTVFGPRSVLQAAARRLGLEPVLSRFELRSVGEIADAQARPGTVNAPAGASAVHSASAAIRACDAGEFDALVAGPHNETAIHQAGIAFNGYPSLVQQVCASGAGKGDADGEVFLLLIGGGLRIVHVTLHESVGSALRRITPQRIVAATRAGARACAMLGLAAPRIALFGINPHASEGGLFGDEDAALVVPAARQLRESGLQVDGPAGADALLADRRHDLYVAMLHDQGHIPVKLLAPQRAVALSIGARVLLATTGHGSAMEIAGQGSARPDAMLRAIRLLAGRTID